MLEGGKKAGRQRGAGRDGEGGKGLVKEFIQGHCPGFAPITCGLGRRKGGEDKKGGLISHIQCISYNRGRAFLPALLPRLASLL